MRAAAPTAILTAALTACSGTIDVLDRPEPARLDRFELAGQFHMPPGGRDSSALGRTLGGISGLASTNGGTELLGITDDPQGMRAYRFRIEGSGAGFRVSVIDVIPLADVPGAPESLDPEGIAVLPNGNLLVSSDGVGKVLPRIPPGLVEYTPQGSFVRVLPLRDRFRPNAEGPLAKGVRPNIGFESLTIAPDGRRVFTATESAIVQDGELATFERGAPARLLEYERRGDRYVPAREFVYRIEPVDRPAFEPGTFINGLVELLSTGGEELLALERSYVQNAGGTGRSVNRIRLFRISLKGATDVSSVDALAALPGYTPVAKSLVLDLSNVSGLSPELAPGLDNFEGLAFGPRLPDGRQSLLMVSDDNFNVSQRTWFLQFALGEAPRAQRIQ